MQDASGPFGSTVIQCTMSGRLIGRGDNDQVESIGNGWRRTCVRPHRRHRRRCAPRSRSRRYNQSRSDVDHGRADARYSPSMSTRLGSALGGHSLAPPYWKVQRAGALLNTPRARSRQRPQACATASSAPDRLPKELTLALGRMKSVGPDEVFQNRQKALSLARG